MNKRSLRIFLTVSLLLAVSYSCNDKDSVVPNVYVDFAFYLSDPDYSALNSPGNSIYVSGGVNGIIIYRIDNETFAAYDRTCTFNVEENCVVVLDGSGAFARDTSCCGSEFLLIDGIPTDGPATIQLKPYRTYYDPSQNLVRVYN